MSAEKHLVLCARYADTPTDALRHLEVVGRLEQQLAAQGAQLVAWGADRFAFAFPADAVQMALQAAHFILTEVGEHAVGLSARTLLKAEDGSARVWGLGLVLAETLANAARPGELLVDPELRERSVPGLTELGGAKVRLGDVVLRAAMLTALPAQTRVPAADERSLPPPKRTPLTKPTPTRSRPPSHPPPRELSTAPRLDLSAVVPQVNPGVGTSVLPRPAVASAPSPVAAATPAALPRSSEKATPPPKPSSVVGGSAAGGGTASGSATSGSTERRSSPPQKPRTIPPRPIEDADLLLESIPPPALMPTGVVRNESLAVEAEVEAGEERRSQPPPKPKSMPPQRESDRPGARPERPSIVDALKSRDPNSMLALAGQLKSEVGQEALAERLEAMAMLAQGEVGNGLGALREAATNAKLRDSKNQGRAALALAVGLLMAGKKQEALLQGLEALSRARSRGDAKGETACVSFIGQLARAAGHPEVASAWINSDPGASAKRPSVRPEQP